MNFVRMTMVILLCVMLTGCTTSSVKLPTTLDNFKMGPTWYQIAQTYGINASDATLSALRIETNSDRRLQRFLLEVMVLSNRGYIRWQISTTEDGGTQASTMRVEGNPPSLLPYFEEVAAEVDKLGLGQLTAGMEGVSMSVVNSREPYRQGDQVYVLRTDGTLQPAPLPVLADGWKILLATPKAGGSQVRTVLLEAFSSFK